MTLTKRQYRRALELLAVIHEEVGEVQKSFNDYVWKGKGTRIGILTELSQIQSPIEELQELLQR